MKRRVLREILSGIAYTAATIAIVYMTNETDTKSLLGYLNELSLEGQEWLVMHFLRRRWRRAVLFVGIVPLATGSVIESAGRWMFAKDVLSPVAYALLELGWVLLTIGEWIVSRLR